MIENERLVRARLGMLALAAELHNVTKACRLAGLSRSQFYAMKKAYELNGKEGLLPRVRRKPTMPNRTPQYIEQEILLLTCKKPMLSYIRLAHEMKSVGMVVTPTMVRYVWQRHGLTTRSARVEWVRNIPGQANSQEISTVQVDMRTDHNSDTHPFLRTNASESENSVNATENKEF